MGEVASGFAAAAFTLLALDVATFMGGALSDFATAAFIAVGLPDFEAAEFIGAFLTDVLAERHRLRVGSDPFLLEPTLPAWSNNMSSSMKACSSKTDRGDRRTAAFRATVKVVNRRHMRR